MSSPRRNHHSSSTYCDFFTRFENRNSEEVHAAALEAARVDRQRIYEAALRAAQNEELRQQQLKLQEEIKQKEERVRLEEERVREEIRLREIENRAKSIPQVPARVPTPPPSVQQPAATPATRPAPAPAPAPAQSTVQKQPVATPTTQPPAQSLQSNGLRTTQSPASQPINPFAQKASQPLNPFPQPPSQPSNPFAQEASQQSNPFVQQPTQPSNPFANAASQSQSIPQQPVQSPQPQSTAPQSNPQLHPAAGRYVEIHKKLKEFRKYVANLTGSNKAFKNEAGELRRSLRMAIGQCVKDKSKNKGPIDKIKAALMQSLTSGTSPGVDPSMFMLSKPEPCEGAINNGDQLPSLFIFLLNYFAKYAVSQFINEAGVNPEIADPIGVVVVHVFSTPQFLWRGHSLIDILMAKMRVNCPVLFGVRGNEKTEEGRASVGWIREKKDGAAPYISEEMHGGRMTGLAAGYAAISLRDFSKSKLNNPWPPTNYWKTISSITATPPNERSVTQYLVLRSMIDGYEGTFLKFYGNTARACLIVALVEYPAGALAPNSAVDQRHSAVGSVQMLADKLAKDRGIFL